MKQAKKSGRTYVEKKLEWDIEPEKKKEQKPVTCLGMTFENDDERRKYFTELLREKLKDPEFRKIEGFPIGEDEDILALSDPPYYTACPNPWIADFIAEWEEEKKRLKSKVQSPKSKVESQESEVQSSGAGADSTLDYGPETLDPPYHREPFATDVSEGKNDPIYNAHSYHTKVPHKAIMRYILHYTEPGDIVFDGFCGTGMTGVAAQMCGDRDAVMSLGYRVEKDGTILQEETDENGKKVWKPFSKLGPRKAVLNDLSPAATFIAYNYNTPVDVTAFEKEAKRILKEVEEECGWMYETIHTDGKTRGKINYTVWSDVFVCPECAEEVVFWDAAVDKEAGKVKDLFSCTHCRTELSKRNMERVWVTHYDEAIKSTIRLAKQVPVLINYNLNGKRVEKNPDLKDLSLIDRIDKVRVPPSFPNFELPNGYNTQQPKLSHGFTHIHHFYTKRNMYALSCAYEKVNENSPVRFLFTGFINRATKLNQLHLKNYFFGGGGCNAGHRKGTLYAPSISMETPISDLWNSRVKTQLRSFIKYSKIDKNIISTASANSCTNQSIYNKFDYIFIDPPFGSNINYSELSFLWEGWLRLFTNISPEAIENKIQKKGPNEYRFLMEKAFGFFYNALKPGHWCTIEFSNTNAYVWNIIQNALLNAGFIIANVSSLDKKQGGMATIRSKIAVLKDLVISAYKPNGGFEKRFLQSAQSEEGVWEFVRTHLKYLPVTKNQAGVPQVIPERDPRILFDQMVAYFVRKGYPVPISSQEFQEGLAQRFSERDGMYFLPEQTNEYDRKKMMSGKEVQLYMAVFDENSAIQWLRYLLRKKPQTFSDINPQFMKQLGGWKKNEAPLDLRELLNQNFLCYDGKEAVPSQIHSYLSTNWPELRNLDKDDPVLKSKAKDRWYVPDPRKAGDLEKMREKVLLKEFDQYKQAKKKLKVFRLEAVRAGFKKAWQQRDYSTIITIAEKIPNKILEEDPKLLMWYDQAVTRDGGGE